MDRTMYHAPVTGGLSAADTFYPQRYTIPLPASLLQLYELYKLCKLSICHA